MLSRLVRCFAPLVLMLVLAGCGAGIGALVATPQLVRAPHVEVPPESKAYTTSNGSNGVLGGSAASDAEFLLQAELPARGDDAKPDAALAAVAASALRSAYAKESASTETLTEASHRFGFAGLFLGFAAGPLEQESVRRSLKDLVSQVPKNVPINRYGIVAGQGSDVAVVIGSVQATLRDFPRVLPAGGNLQLDGVVDDRYEHASVFSTNPEGKVREIRMKDRKIDAMIEFPTEGLYQLEIMGYGLTGPVVIMNVPIEVGTLARKSSARAVADPELTAEDAEATLLALLNQERNGSGIPAVAADAELRTVALAHSVDMAEHGFVGHVSPTTGTPEERVKQARIRISRFGECVALEFTPERAYQTLMASPAHRAVMIDPRFTHVGIGVTFRDAAEHGGRRLVATLLFGIR